MTVAIGVLCNSGRNILLGADTLISYGNVSSNIAGSKIYEGPHGLHLAVADDVSWAHVVASQFLNELDKLDPDDDSLLDKVKARFKDAAGYAFGWWRDEVLKTRTNITSDEYLHDQNLSPAKMQEADDALEMAKQQGLPIEMIIAGFWKKGPIFLYSDGIKLMEQASPGNVYAGSGAGPATDWLNYRQQNLHNPWEVSYYHLLEAMHFARLSTAVGPAGAVLLLGPGGKTYKLQRTPKSENYKLTAKLFKQHWIRRTDKTFSKAEIREKICKANNVPFVP